MPLKKHSFLYAFLIIALLVFLAGTNYAWLMLDQRPPVDDEAVHLISCLKFYDYIVNAAPFSLFIRLHHFYPPLFPLLAACGGILAGKSAVVFIMTNLFYMAGTALCLYYLGRNMGQPGTGVLAAYILSLYPLYFRLSRMCMLETALVFAVTASITVLRFTDNFKKLGMSALFGVCVGAGLLTKQYYLVFLAGPVLFALVRVLKKNGNERRRAVVHLALSLLIGAGIAAVWYVPNAKTMGALLIDVITSSKYYAHEFPVFSRASLFFYLNVLVDHQIGVFLFMFFVWAFLLLLRKKEKEAREMLVVWVLVPLIILTLFKNKFLYYSLSCLPAVAYISARGMTSMRNGIVRTSLITAVMTVGLLQYVVVSYVDYRREPGPFLMNQFFSPNMILEGRVPFFLRGDWKAAEIMQMIRASGREKPVVAVLWNDPNVQRKKAMPEDLFGGSRESYAVANPESLRYFLVFNKISASVVIVKEQALMAQLKNADLLISQSFCEEEGLPFPEIFLMPDKSEVYVYKLREN